MMGSSPPKPASRVGEIDIPCYARFAPSLDGDPADEAGTPPLAVAEGLQFPGGCEEIVHWRSFANQACISTMPEEGRGGRVRKA